MKIKSNLPNRVSACIATFRKSGRAQTSNTFGRYYLGQFHCKIQKAIFYI